MNDNQPLKYDWHQIIHDEWGYWPVSCAPDVSNPKKIYAVFDRPIKVDGHMKINGFEIVPRELVLASPSHPFSNASFHPSRRQRARQINEVLAIR
ncbi:MAG: hypothetical protein K2Q32_07560 [Alphaproteobacteria bacterium]|nr:hypothetical protein [Alphaproteobacteria bacterium]